MREAGTVSNVDPEEQNDLEPISYDDAIDVPVLIRDGPGGRPWKKWRTAPHEPWQGHEFPKNGWYLPTTTWREIIKAAADVGRDITPWLSVPQMAAGELVARIAPLYAFLTLHDAPASHDYNAGRRLTTNAVFEHGTEESARSAFNYRLGMTMSQWVCRLMGLGQTFHLEDSWPGDITDPEQHTKKAKGQTAPRPDLWGTHVRREALLARRG